MSALAEAGTVVLSVADLSVRFGGVEALTDLRLDVKAGRIHAVIGPNGAGKSTCFNAITGVVAPSGGSIRFGKNDLVGLKPHEIADLGIARTFQNIVLAAQATIEENLLLGRHRLMRSGYLRTAVGLSGAEEREHRERVRELAALLRIDHLLGAKPSELSYGHRKRAEICRALAAEPALLLLDEPVAGMSIEESREMADLIRQLNEEQDLTILLVEHDMDVVMGTADAITVLDSGRTIASGAPAQVREDPEVLRAYLGTVVEETA